MATCEMMFRDGKLILNSYEIELLRNRYLRINNRHDLRRRVQWYNLLLAIDEALGHRKHTMARILIEEYHLIGYTSKSLQRFLSKKFFYKLGSTDNGLVKKHADKTVS